MPRYTEQEAKLISRSTGDEIKPGTAFPDLTFLYISRLPEGASSGRVMTDARPGGEFFPSVLDARIEVVRPTDNP